MGTIFISQDSGNDGNAGTSEGAPVKSLKQAVTNANSGDTIQILDSLTYQPGLAADGGRILVGQKALSFVAATGQTPTFAGLGARTNGATTKSAFNCSGMTVAGTVMSFEGITFEDFNGSGNTIVTSNGQTAPTQKFIDCVFQNMDQSIITTPAAATSGEPNLVDRCEIKSTTPDLFLGPGSHMQNQDHHIVIQNSIFHNTSSSPSTNYIDCQNNSHTNGIIRNCTLLVDRVNAKTVIRFGVVENVIIKNTATGSVDSDLVGIDARSSYSNNCVNGSFGDAAGGGAIKDNIGAGATDGGGHITGSGSDPLFVNQSSIPEGLKLQSGSPCIGTGKTIAAVTVDFAGTSRSAPYDIGAFVFTSTAAGFTDDGSETYSRKFGSNSFLIHGTANKLATRGFADNKDNRQAPFSVTVAGPATIRRRTTPYKSET